ncbi:MAG: transposase [Planctomycetes bacterium]|nr:transposase [Planctomycetota bacterium]
MPDWPHAPVHRLSETGAYMVTAGTYQKVHHLWDVQRLDLVLNTLMATASEFGWLLQAWAVMSNHYHFLAMAPPEPESLRDFVRKLHAQTGRRLNELDGAPGRRVWYQFFDSHITYERSYFARLKYVHENPVHHGLIEAACNYRWCSAAWFEREAQSAFQKTIASFPIDRINVLDPFAPETAKD